MTAPELKPCPFCGGKAYLANVAMVGCAYVVCTDCRMQSDDGSQERVVAAWNTRADLVPAAALAVPEVAALVEAVENIRDYATILATPEQHAALAKAIAALRGEGQP